MKQSFLITTVIISLLAVQSAFGQVKGYGLRGGIAMPTGDFGDLAGVGFGAVGTAFYEFQDNIVFTGSVGYFKFGGEDVATGFFNQLEINYSLIPITSGARYYLAPKDAGTRFYVGGDIGYFIFSVSVEDDQGNSATSGFSSTSKIGLAPAVGVELGGIDIHAAYSLADFNYLSLGVGFMFGR